MSSLDVRPNLNKKLIPISAVAAFELPPPNPPPNGIFLTISTSQCISLPMYDLTIT